MNKRKLRRPGLHVIALVAAGLALGMLMASCADDSNPVTGKPAASSWSWQSPFAGGNGLNDVAFTDANTGVAVGTGGVILRTRDGGTTWVRQTSRTTAGLVDVSFGDANRGIVVGSTILRTIDGGATWERRVNATTSLFGVSFVDANTATAVGWGGAILRTINGGATWEIQTPDTAYSLFGVSFTQADTGTAVGFYGAIIRTTNGGETWVRQTSGTTASLHDVSFTDADTGMVVGDGGTILRTTNGGATRGWRSAMRARSCKR